MIYLSPKTYNTFSRSQNYVPQRAKDANGIMRIIINDKEKPIQKFNIATCK